MTITSIFEDQSIDCLTNRQQEILTFLTMGDSVKEFAGTIYLTPKSVEGHKHRIMKTLGLHDQVLRARYAIRNGFVLPFSFQNRCGNNLVAANRFLDRSFETVIRLVSCIPRDVTTGFPVACGELIAVPGIIIPEITIPEIAVPGTTSSVKERRDEYRSKRKHGIHFNRISVSLIRDSDPYPSD